jgi:aminoglycoside phosphotransferase (APT) family kinase protein
MAKAEVAARYAAMTGLSVESLPYYEGLALYRIAVIVEQIYARYAAGQTEDRRFAMFEPVAPALASAALRALGG